MRPPFRNFAIECDLQLTSDGVPVVFHDDDLERLTGKSGPVSAITSAELTTTPLLGSADGNCPQRFTDFLAQVRRPHPLQVELKFQRDVAVPSCLLAPRPNCSNPMPARSPSSLSIPTS